MYPNLQTKTSDGNQSSTSETDPWLSALDQYLEEAYADSELSIRDMAENMGLSERQFYRKVKQLTGQTPLQYIRDLRLKRARELLEAGQIDTVNELAAEVGYIRTDYFSRLFKKAFGFSPYQGLRD
jgi:AraC-like DNA-binding protein